MTEETHRGAGTPAESALQRGSMARGKRARLEDHRNADSEADGVTRALPIVAVGASVEARAPLEEFLAALSGASWAGGVGLVLIVHAGQETSEQLLQWLAPQVQSAGLSLVLAAHDMSVIAGRAYLLPPRTYMGIQSGCLQRSAPLEWHGPMRTIDHFARALAAERGERAACVLLPGTDGDGVHGMRHIKANGGTVLVAAQGGDGEARDGMDGVQPVGTLVQTLARVVQSAPTGNDEPLPVAPAELDWLGDLLALVEAQFGQDFRGYKPDTLVRRIRRRMTLAGASDPQRYSTLLREDPEAVKALYNDLLIGVTGFFREPEAWRFLERDLVGSLLGECNDQTPLRVWVAGCATGQEAYSIAVLLAHHAERGGVRRKIQVFATDIDHSALEIARAGVYPESAIEDVPEELRRYFTLQGGRCEINKPVRELVVFAPQNLIADPPFSRIDLITCRNVLIYMDAELQDRAFSVFHYALRKRGVLMLGGAESLGGQHESLFEPLSRKWRVYRRSEGAASRSLEIPLPRWQVFESRPNLAADLAAAQPASLAAAAQAALLERYAPAAVLIDRELHAVYFSGPTQRYLAQPTGEPTCDLLALARQHLAGPLQQAVRRALRESRTVRTLVRGAADSAPRSVRISVAPLQAPPALAGLLLITFEPQPHPERVRTPGPLSTRVLELEDELRAARDELQLRIQDLVTANEGLRASNEEVMTINEELETSREELQLLNEELVTVNRQLQEKITAVERAHDDMQNLLESTETATAFLDRELRIQRYTPTTADLLRLRPTDLGRPLEDIALRFEDPLLQEDLRRVLEDPTPRIAQVRGEDGRWYLRRVLAYRTSGGRTEGAVLTLADISALKHAEQLAAARALQQATVARLGHSALAGADLQALMDEAAALVAQTLEVEYCKVMELLSPERGLLLRAGVGWQPGLVGTAVVGAGLDSQAGFALVSAGPVIVDDLRTERRFREPRLLSQHGVVSGMSALIRGPAGEPFGVLGAHTRSRRTFTDDDVHFLTGVANVLAAALQRAHAEAALRDNQERLRFTLEAAHVGTWDWDMDSGAVHWSDNLEAIHGRAPGDFTGSFDSVLADVHPDDRAVLEGAIADACGGPGDYRVEYRVTGADGAVRWVEGKGRVIRDAAGRAVRMTGVCADITERKRSEEALCSSEKRLRQQAHALAQADRQKNEFLAMLGHELRNPLSPIRNAAQLLKEGRETHDPERVEWCVDVILRQVTQMTRLVDDLLDVSRITRGSITLRPKLVDVAVIISQAAETIIPRMEERHQELRIELPGEPLMLRGDAVRLVQVLANLLNNAAKFSGEGARVQVRAYRDGGDAVIVVKDSGIGIAPDLLPHVFDLFTQGESSLHRPHGGLGLGLTLVQRLVEMHGGRVTACSAGTGQGSEFAVRLPARVEQAQVGSATTQAAAPAPAPGTHRVLVVDDNVDSANALAALLQIKGCEVDIAYDGAGALDHAVRFRPHAVFLDIGLPQMDGYEVARRLRALPREWRLVLIALSGYEPERTGERAERAAFDQYVLKPIDLERLDALLEMLVPVTGAPAAGDDPPPAAR